MSVNLAWQFKMEDITTRNYDENSISKAIADIIKCMDDVNNSVDKVLCEIESIGLSEEAINHDFIGEIDHIKFQLTSYLDAYCKHLQTIKRNYEVYDISDDLPLEVDKVKNSK